MLMVTCTDTATLAGPNQEACFGRYGSVAVKAAYHAELSLRMLLNALQQCAARYGRHIEPMLSVSVDFYIRVFVRVRTAKREVLRAATRSGLVYQCKSCPAFWVQPLGEERGGKTTAAAAAVPGGACPECGSGVALGGPYYTGPLHDAAALDRAAAHLAACGAARYRMADRLAALVRVCQAELGAPLYYDLHGACGLLRQHAPQLLTVHAALANAGFRYSHVHCRETGIKTDAPPSFFADMLRAWAREHPPSEKWKKKEPHVARFFDKPASHEVDFTVSEHARAERRAFQRETHFVPTPEAHWGPLGRPGKSSRRAPRKRQRGRGERRGTAGGEGDGEGEVAEAAVAEKKPRPAQAQ